MEACRCVEFTGVELAGGVELVALVEKGTTGLVEKALTDLARAVIARVEKVVHALVTMLEMGEGGRPPQAGGAVEMDEGGQPHSGTVEMSADRHSGCHGERRHGAAECGHGTAERKRPSVGSFL
jgi:hypothetical protein